MEKCWKFHGYPHKTKSNTWRKQEEDQSSKANVSVSEAAGNENKGSEARITQEQYAQLMNILNSKNSIISDVQEVSHTSNLAQLAGTKD